MINRGAVTQAVAIAGLSALVGGLASVGIDEIKALLSERREKRKEREGDPHQ